MDTDADPERQLALEKAPLEPATLEPPALGPTAAGHPEGDRPPSMSTAEQRYQALHAELAGLGTQVNLFQQLIDRLHTENEDLRRGQLDRLLEPVFRDLMKLADDWRRMASSWAPDRAAAQPEQVAGLCRAMVEDVDMILERHGVEPAVPEVGSSFDRREHRAVGDTSVDDPALDGTVSGVSRPGYRFGGRILRFPEVLVRRFTASAPG